MFIELNMMISFYFYFQETYNNRLRERYGDDTLTHPEFNPDLWMEVGSSGGPDKNRVYGLSNTTANNLRSTRSVSTVGSSQSKEFVALQQSTRNTTTYKRSTHNSKRLMHNKERSLSNSKRLKHNKKRSMKRLRNSKKRLMTSFTK